MHPTLLQHPRRAFIEVVFWAFVAVFHSYCELGVKYYGSFFLLMTGFPYYGWLESKLFAINQLINPFISLVRLFNFVTYSPPTVQSEGILMSPEDLVAATLPWQGMGSPWKSPSTWSKRCAGCCDYAVNVSNDVMPWMNCGIQTSQIFAKHCARAQPLGHRSRWVHLFGYSDIYINICHRS